MDDIERQFQEADAAVDKAVAVFISKIEAMSGKWDAVTECEAPMRVQTFPPRTGLLCLRHSTLDEPVFFPCCKTVDHDA